jgi:glycosyltransferase involved in cell wall biosynthesis
MGRIENIKGIYTLIKASYLAPNAKVVLAGKADDVILNKINKIFPRNVQYVGLKKGQHLKNLLLEARAVVVPSIWYENQPFSIIESFACGKPVIASKLGGMKELVAHGERGLLITPGDHQALADTMIWMTQNSEKASEMGENARLYAYAEHGSDKHYEKIMDIYNKAIK